MKYCRDIPNMVVARQKVILSITTLPRQRQNLSKCILRVLRCAGSTKERNHLDVFRHPPHSSHGCMQTYLRDGFTDKQQYKKRGHYGTWY